MRALLLIAVAGLLMLVAAPAALLLSMATSATPAVSTARPGSLALQDIPAPALSAYERAAARAGAVPWWLLAAIAKVESDHGRSNLPGVHSGSNAAGAQGPFQLLPATWARYGRSCGGRGPADVYSLADAACAAAHYLQALWQEHWSWRQAIFGYDHSWDYVDRVWELARRYAGGQLGTARDGGQVTQSRGPAAPLFSSLPQGGFPDPFPYGQCTWWAARNHRVSWSGNATDWLANARAQGVATSPLPSVGAIAVWRSSPGYSAYGHVAVVTAVGPDGSFSVSEMNYLGLALIDTRVARPDWRLEGFIP